jgi:hypothetical protein
MDVPVIVYYEYTKIERFAVVHAHSHAALQINELHPAMG